MEPADRIDKALNTARRRSDPSTPNSLLIGAVEAGGTKFNCALARADGTRLATGRIATTTPGPTFASMRDFFACASAAHGPIAGFGIGAFGPIDLEPASTSYGTITNTPKPGWPGARYQDVLGQFGAPIVIDTDVNAAALGEWLAGGGRGCDAIAYTTVGTGIGTGFLRGGVSQIGISHPESGHIRVPHDWSRDPFAGACSFHGDCLEGLASGAAIGARWDCELPDVPDQEHAISLIARYLADLAATLVLLAMPERLIFGGGVMKTPGLLEALRQQTGERLAGYVRPLDRALQDYIVPPALGDEAGITGALELGRRAALSALAKTPA